MINHHKQHFYKEKAQSQNSDCAFLSSLDLVVMPWIFSMTPISRLGKKNNIIDDTDTRKTPEPIVSAVSRIMKSLYSSEHKDYEDENVAADVDEGYQNIKW